MVFCNLVSSTCVGMHLLKRFLPKNFDWGENRSRACGRKADDPFITMCKFISAFSLDQNKLQEILKAATETGKLSNLVPVNPGGQPRYVYVSVVFRFPNQRAASGYI